MAEIDWDEIRKNYPITSKQVYFNNASMGPLPTNIRQTLQKFLDDWNTGDITHRFHVDRYESIREKVARFLGVTPGEIGFCHNTSEGVVRASQSIPFKKGDNIVLPYNEFPANVFPWKEREPEGVEIRFAGKGNFYVTEQDIMACSDDNTRCIAASAVSFASGYKLDLGVLSEFCHERNIYFFSDIIQGAGSMNIDLGNSKVDMAAFESIKWIPASSGTGVFYCSKNVLDNLKLTHIGWLSVERNGLENLLDFNLPPYKSARRFDTGSGNLLGMIGLDVAIDYYLGIGMKHIETRILYLVDLIITGLTKLGYRVLSSTEPIKRSGIVYFSAKTPDQLMNKLRENGIIVALRNGNIRVSPHFYCNETDVERFLNVLEKY